MGKVVGLPEWLLATLFVITGVAIVFAFAWQNTKRQIAATLATRPNPTKAEFLAAMRADVSPTTAEFLWRTALFYLEPSLTPPPDDDLVHDLPIDNDDFSMDWPRDFAQLRGFHESHLHDWPEGWPVTVRNYGRWLDMGPVFYSSQRHTPAGMPPTGICAQVTSSHDTVAISQRPAPAANSRPQRGQ